MICAGIDAGSRTIKVVLLESDSGQVVAQTLADQGIEQGKLAADLFEGLLAEQGLDRADIGSVVATGYGRGAVEFADTTITEITCHAAGVRAVAPQARTMVVLPVPDVPQNT